MKHVCRNANRRMGVAVAITVAIASATCSGHAAAASFEGISIEVVGKGKPVLMIPGLNSSADVWKETCAGLQPQVQCHIVNLPGFAGVPAVETESFVTDMRDRLLRYTDQKKLKKPAIVGHSLGGELALMMAIEAPKRFEQIVVVDSLPFFGGVRNPNATAADVKPMAENMRAGMLASDDATYKAQARMYLAGMSNQKERMETLALWGDTSDRKTTAQAMYELTITDLRADLAKVETPTLVLGAWASYAQYGATKDSVRKTFETQYAALDGVKIELSEGGYHFLMWDDPQWLQGQVRGFLGLATK